MISKRLDDITEDDLLALISNAVSEGRTIDYKRELPGNSDSDKREFLADASSFANTGGGDLVFGMDEGQGLPIQVTGFQSADADLEIRRMDSILASGLEPRVRYAMRLIPCRGSEKVLILRVERSWSGPHRVVFKGHDRFYGRNSAGKYPLDVNELRMAFTFSHTVTERIRAFRTDRIIALSNNETPIPFVDDSKIVIHIIPIESFAGQAEYDMLPFYDNPGRFRPMASSNWNRRLNLEGLLDFSIPEPSHSYAQLYRTGIIEAVQGSLLVQEDEGRPTIPSIAYEKYILDYLPHCFEVLKELGASTPVVVALTLTKTRGLFMGTDTLRFGFDRGYSIESKTLILPEVVVQDFSIPVSKILKPTFDLVWNACGYPSSRNFDAEGKWVAR